MTTWTDENQRTLTEQLTQITRDSPGHWSFAVRESGRQVAAVDAEQDKTPASTIKVAVLVMVLQDVAGGRLSLEQSVPIPTERVGGSGVLTLLPSVERLTIAEIAEMMIVVSDNEATNILIRLLGLESMTERLAGLGMHHTQIQRTLMDVHLPGRNATTAADQALLLDALSGELLPDELRTFALDMLLRQQFNSRMPARLSPDVVCRHKTGEIIGIRHDVGILQFDDRMISFAALGSELQEAIDDGGPGPVDDIVARAAATVVATARESARAVARDSAV